MILTKSVIIKITKSNIKYYSDIIKDYTIKTGDIITINPIYLSKGSHVIIEVACDNPSCDCIRMMRYQTYYGCYNNGGSYYCNNCKYIKASITNLERYGVNNPMQNLEIQNKLCQTNLNRYGVKYTILDESVKEKIKETNLERYGVVCTLHADIIKYEVEKSFEKYENGHPSRDTNVKEKKRLTNLEKYGVEYPTQHEKTKDKTRKTNLKKYGCVNVGQNNIIKEKIKNTFNIKYKGHPFKDSYILNKIKTTLISKYNEDNYFKTAEFKLNRDNILFNKYKQLNLISVKDGNYVIYCEKCEKVFEINNDTLNRRLRNNSKLCILCNPLGHTSISEPEHRLFDLIRSNYDGEIIQNDRKLLSGLELDIYLPAIKLAFEYNGIYWHSNYYKASDYHLNKSNLCEQLGINLVHIYEDDWKGYKNNIIKTNILKLLGKNCIYLQPNEHYNIIENIDNDICKQFVDENSITSIDFLVNNISLYIGDILVAIMFFDNDNISHCEHIDYNGSLHILFDYIIKKYNFNKIDIYIDRSWPLVDEYLKLGFTIAENMEPIKYYVSGCNRTDTITDMYIYDSGKFKLTYNKL